MTNVVTNVATNVVTNVVTNRYEEAALHALWEQVPSQAVQLQPSGGQSRFRPPACTRASWGDHRTPYVQVG